MITKQRPSLRFLLFATPLMASSAFVAAPGWAATLAKSEATVELNKFSHSPVEVEAFTEAFTEIFTSSSEVTADADAFAEFTADPSPKKTSAFNFSLSKIEGEGKSYFGQVKSVAGVIGYNFLVNAGQTFSFDFSAFLGLKTSIDEPEFEYASASSEVNFQLYNTQNNKDTKTWIPLDFFSLAGKIKTLEPGDFLAYEKSANVTVKPNKVFLETSFGGNEETAEAFIQGKFSRKFDSLTYLTLVETKTNKVKASKAIAETPEFSSTLALLLFCLMGVGYEARKKAVAVKSK